jgi:hypothetical protein
LLAKHERMLNNNRKRFKKNKWKIIF